MTDNQLTALLIATLTTGLTAQGRPAAVLQSFQPTQQGTDPRPAVYLHHLGSKAYGFRGRRTVPGNPTPGMVNHAENQYWERTFQVNALAPDGEPTATPDLTAPTAFDYVASANAVLQSDAGRRALLAGGVGILRITDVREPYFKNDKDRYENSPSFDFTVKFQLTQETQEPAITPPVKPGIHRV